MFLVLPVVVALTLLSVTASAEGPHPWLSSIDDSSVSYGCVSQARIETPPLLDEVALDLWDDLEHDKDWNPRHLNAGSDNIVVPPLRPSAGLLRLRLEGTTHPSAFSSQLELELELHGKKHFKKTGTTIAGCICRGHVILAADTRATEDSIVADASAQKLHLLALNAWCAGAGTSADLEMVTKHCLHILALEQLQASSIGNDGGSSSSSSSKTKLLPLYTTAAKEEEGNHALFVGMASLESICTFLQDQLQETQGQLGVNLILGCVDPNGRAHLRVFHGHGSMDVDLPFAAMGSGGLAAMSFLERGYHANMTVPEAIALVQSAIVAGIQNDLGSGSQVDLCVIYPDGTSRMERCVVPPQRLPDLEQEPQHVETNPPPNPDSAGANGFGNTPFGISSRRVLVESQQTQTLKDWHKLLGL